MIVRLFDGPNRNDLLPFAYTRCVADIFMGTMTFRDRWKKQLNLPCSVETEAYLAESEVEKPERCILASCLPSSSLIKAIHHLKPHQKLISNNLLLAYHGHVLSSSKELDTYQSIEFEEAFIHIRYPWDIFSHNARQITIDIETKTEPLSFLSSTNTTIGDYEVSIAQGANVEYVHLNTTQGPIYVDKEAEVMEGSYLRGPLYIGPGVVIKMGTKVYGGCSFGANVKVGGELNNVVFFENSNKGHEGFLGNAVVGSWCNIGAGTDASNLKNDYGLTKAWNYPQQKFIQTGLQFCGLLMGDHSKCAIHTSFNTATMVGVGANIFGSGFPRTFIPSFSRGGSQGYAENRLDKVILTAKKVMARRAVEFTIRDEEILKNVFHLSAEFRKF